MLNARIRLAFLLATVMVSFHVAAVTRFWALKDVQFDDGAIATGYFSYDDVTQEIGTWDVRVSAGPEFILFNYLPDNSESLASGPYISFGATIEQPAGRMRWVDLSPLTELDGSNPVVSLYLYPDFRYSAESIGDGFFVSYLRLIIRGSLVLMPVPPSTSPPTVARVVEFYNQSLRHYFITADAADKHDLDTGVHPGWMRTGESFKAYAPDVDPTASINSVCRYYGDPSVGIDSHFFSADRAECDAVQLKYPTDWRLETTNAFKINLPNTTTGVCPSGTIPVYRLWNQRVDSNHRYTTNVGIRNEMLGLGYKAEGYGPDRVAMCAR